MVVKTISGGSHPEIEPKWLIMALLNPEHMTVQGNNPLTTYIFHIYHGGLLAHMVVETILGGAHPEIELTGPTMAL